MDHIRLPANSSQPVLEVPYLAQSNAGWAYDNLDFLSYPERKGFDRSKFVSGGYEPSEMEFALAILQSWCYFGLVVEFFGAFDIIVSVEDFLDRDASGVGVVTSGCLPGLLRRLECMERKSDDDNEQAEQFQTLDLLLTSVSAFVSEVDVERLQIQYTEHHLVQSSADKVLPSTLDVVHLSVIILGQCLDLGARMINAYGNFWGHSPYLQQRLLRAGWCRSETYTFLEQLSGDPSCLYYIANISPRTVENAYEHRYCGDTLRCNRENLDRRRYKTQHALSCVNPDECPIISFQEPDCPNISSIVSKGLTPAVTAIPGTSGQKPLCSVTGIPSLGRKSNDSIKNEIEQIPYVCISHVWSDGLGNLEENAIPQCQMLRLQTLVNELFEPERHPVHFWLDTLCVPLQYPLRRIAINSMKTIYEGASKVLVIDSILGQASVQGTDVVELAMRVRVSTWGRRLWTFHEACLAHQLYYQYQDRALTSKDFRSLTLERQVEEDEEWRRSCDGWKSTLPESEFSANMFRVFHRKSTLNPIEAEALIWISTQENYLHKVTGEPFFRRLSRLTNCLRYRWTSWLEDETICLSGILGLEVESLTSISESDSVTTQECRMQQFLGSLDEVPADFLFLKQPRVKQKGSEWMPNSFLGNSFSMYTMEFGKGTPTPEGLLVNLPGMVLPEIDDRRPLESIFVGYEDSFLKIRLTRVAEYEWDDYCLMSSAIIFRYPLNITVSAAPGMVSMETEGLWVTFENDPRRSDDAFMTVRFGQHVTVKVRAVEDLPLDSEDHVVTAESCEPSQCWCVG